MISMWKTILKIHFIYLTIQSTCIDPTIYLLALNFLSKVMREIQPQISIIYFLILHLLI